jgi:Uncharacterized protein conserved in bacteria
MKAQCATVATAAASRYLTQLCKHFAHKIPVSVEEGRGRADFPWGTCRMEAAADTLTLLCEAEDAEGLERVKAVVADHLGRFGWREGLTVVWEAA